MMLFLKIASCGLLTAVSLPTDTIAVKKGSEFKLEIRASMGSGFQWMLEDSINKNLILLIESSIKTDREEIAVRPDVQTFVFKALKAGTACLSFVYKRPWKKKMDPNAERKKYYIKIN